MRSHPLDRSQVLPFSGASDLQHRIARSFALITDWNAALHGVFPLEDVVKVLTRQTQAAHLSLVRIDHDRVLSIAAASHPLAQSAAARISGATVRYLRDTREISALAPGSIWRFSELKHEDGFARSDVAAEMARFPEIVAVSTVILEAGEGRIDALDMLFDSPPNPHPELPVGIITQALADAWEVRAPGLVSRLIGTKTRSRAGHTPAIGILSKQNPSGLSRSEQRLCQMLVTGEKAKDIAEMLGISIATVRTHLRNIYSKTGASGQVELISIINAEKGAGA